MQKFYVASPISNLINASYVEIKLPPAWKHANLYISLTPVLSKIAEDFVVEIYVAPAIHSFIDPSQFGGIPCLQLH